METSGADYDPNGYLVSVNGAAPVRISSSGSHALGQVSPGTYSATVTDVAPWCRQATESPGSIEVLPEGDFNLRILIQCETTYRDVVFYTSSFLIKYADVAGAGSNPDRLPFREISCAPQACLQPSVSPDGRTLSYVNGNTNYLFLRAGSTYPHLIVGSPVAHRSPVTWSPDGERIAFISRPAGTTTGSELFVRRLDAGSGSGGTQLTSGSDNVLFPAWSPDGQWINFTRWLPGLQQSQLWRVRPDGSDLQPFDPPVSGRKVTWSLDGKWFAYVGSDGLRMERTDRSDGYRVGHGESVVDPDFAPDGNSIAAVHLQGCLYTLVRISLPAGTMTPLTPTGSACNGAIDAPSSPAWGK
jgi:dipeptidyl aminopeptidase/acylaminoacyl peptidase